MEPQLLERGGIRIAVEGCGHGTLNAIYASIKQSCEVNNWPGVDLVIIGGDFQAVRNAKDLNCLACPPKYRHIGDFHEYYSGNRIAPHLTIFIGGNHEASNHMWELYYGGWAAPNIYYLGVANVVRFGPLRIAGLSGIWKGYNYRKPHFERLPYNGNSEKSIYHVRELDVRKLLAVRTQVDIALSHDWPLGVERCGDYNALFRIKPHFKDESNAGTLGSVAAKSVLDRLRPAYWFSAHMHVKFSAIYEHDKTLQHDFVHGNPNLKSKLGELGSRVGGVKAGIGAEGPVKRRHTFTVDLRNTEEIDLDLNAFDTGKASGSQGQRASAKNDAEINSSSDDIDDKPTTSPPETQRPTAPTRNDAEIELDLSDNADASTSSDAPTANANASTQEVPDSLRSQLPAAFQRSGSSKSLIKTHSQISNKVTRFLALDKCLPGRQFLQIMTVQPVSTPLANDDASQKGVVQKPVLQYDKEWLAITRVFAPELHIGHPSRNVPAHCGEATYLKNIEREEAWVEENLVRMGRMVIPENFEVTAPVQAQGDPEVTNQLPWEYNNPQTGAFCELVGIQNKFFSTEEERAVRLSQALADEHDGNLRGGFGRGGGYHGGRGGGGGGGDGRGRGRGRGRSRSGGKDRGRGGRW